MPLTEATHNQGQILDLAISRGLNVKHVGIVVLDHKCIFFEVETFTPSHTLKEIAIKHLYINKTSV